MLLPASAAQSDRARLELAQQRTEHRVVPQLLVIVQVLITQRDPEHALPHHRPDRVLDQISSPLVDEAVGQPIDQPDRLIRAPQQQRSGIRTDRPAVKRSHHSAAFNT